MFLLSLPYPSKKHTCAAFLVLPVQSWHLHFFCYYPESALPSEQHPFTNLCFSLFLTLAGVESANAAFVRIPIKLATFCIKAQTPKG